MQGPNKEGARGAARMLECAVCLRRLEDGSGVAPRALTCGHAFHASCIDRWLLECRSRATCPVCRACAATEAQAASAAKRALLASAVEQPLPPSPPPVPTQTPQQTTLQTTMGALDPAWLLTAGACLAAAWFAGFLTSQHR